MAHCLYQGTFNPIHNAHIAAAKYVHEKLNFEKIVFIPAFKPPHKNLKDFDFKNAIHRLNMLELALKDYSYFDISVIEYMRNKPSYTYDTIVKIYDIIKPHDKISFIIGTDAFIKIESWYKSGELKNLLNFILFIREDDFDETPYLQLKNKGYNYTLMQMPYMNISASEIRERIKHNKDICDILPLSVAEYIKQNNVYKIQH
ncbi:MAG: nicotinate (nicotinamide) nucleotide adenylyltransferase [Candidatus Gastranaerophilales bacterium]|nr:nicotinate (nicotinamide) nucleotide adenylyltransferase [Candidatus Gastranaerophilales bacterium]